MKIFFIWQILLFSIFCTASFAQTVQNVTPANKNKPSQNADYAKLFNQKVDANKSLIKKNSSEINQTKLKLNKKINANKISINNNKFRLEESNLQTEDNYHSIKHLYNKFKTTDQITEKNQNQIAQSTENIKNNEAKIKINKNDISENSKLLNIYNKNSDNNKLELETINASLNKINNTYGLTSDYLDRFWVLIAGVLVFFMQAGFKTFEAGMVRKEHDDNVAIKNILDWLIISLVYFICGFGLMFGDSYNGLIGTNLFGPTPESIESVKISIKNQFLGMEFFIYQLAFAATAATIVSGAMSERMALIPYILLSVFIGSIIYPIYGHWSWGGTFYQANQGWLYALGFRDFAGSTVVHSIGAWIALAGIVEIGPRIGRYDKDGNLNRKDFIPANLGYSTLGVLILWFGWWGFNGGSQLKYDESIAIIVMNTIIAGSMAGLTAFFHAMSKSHDKYEIFPKLLGGILGGLVAITACCNSVSTHEAIFIGFIAGLVHNYSLDFLMLRLKLDDPVGAVAVHGFCGIWGTLCVAFFGQLDTDFFAQNTSLLFSENSLLSFLDNTHIRIQQTVIQLTGIITAFFFTFMTSLAFFKLVRRIPGVGLRVMPADEKRGSILGISS